MRKQWKLAAALFAAVATLALVAGCTSATSSSTGGATTSTATAKGPIIVGSKIDTEGSILGQIVLQMLKANGFSVVDKTRTGATQVVRQALLSHQIDVYPEYTANGPLVFHSNIKVDPAVLKSAEQTYQLAKSEDASVGVVWLQPAPANNTWAVALPRTFAENNKLVSMTDLAKFVNGGGKIKIVGSQEFFTSAVAFPAFEKAYGFKIPSSQEIALATGDTAVTEKAAATGSQGANAAMAYGTDGTIAALDLVVLSDPLGAQPIYQPAPTFSSVTFKKYPEVATILNPVFGKLDLTALQSLNKQVAVDGKDPATVASEWLKTEGFLK